WYWQQCWSWRALAFGASLRGNAATNIKRLPDRNVHLHCSFAQSGQRLHRQAWLIFYKRQRASSQKRGCPLPCLVGVQIAKNKAP
ncbi:MAG: hypothetical protein RR194_07125, partial [Ruthenibacterium sp.]